jgi:hypothetical protein
MDHVSAADEHIAGKKTVRDILKLFVAGSVSTATRDFDYAAPSRRGTAERTQEYQHFQPSDRAFNCAMVNLPVGN